MTREENVMPCQSEGVRDDVSSILLPGEHRLTPTPLDVIKVINMLLITSFLMSL